MSRQSAKANILGSKKISTKKFLNKFLVDIYLKNSAQ